MSFRRLDLSRRMCLPLAPLLALFALLFSWLPGFGSSFPGGATLPTLPGVSLPTVPGVSLPTIPGGSTGGGIGTPGPSPSGPLTGKYFSGKFTNAAGSRNFTGYIPSGYKSGTAVPLVVALHGCSQSADTISKQIKLDNLAESATFITVYPEQPSSANNLSCWNWFQSANMQRGQGEPSILAGITQWVQQNYTVDAKRTFVEGFSAGGAMAVVMGATYPDLYGAIGVGSGIEYNGGTAALGGAQLDATKAGQAAYQAMGSNARIMPTLIFHGAQDKTVPVANATSLVKQWLTTDDLADDGVINGSVPTTPQSSKNLISSAGQPYTVSSYVDGHGREILQSWVVANMEHAWSGGCSCTSYSYPSGPDETKAMYDFFMAHPKL